MGKRGQYILFAFLALLALATDRASKVVIFRFMEGRSGTPLEVIPGFFSITHSVNTGTAFGMFQNAPSFMLYIPVIVVICVIIFFFLQTQAQDGASAIQLAALGLMLGGAIGNLYDRIVSGRVYDFLLFQAGKYSWPDFNFADIYVVIGAILLGIVLIKDSADER